jgi:hypothetical protein
MKRISAFLIAVVMVFGLSGTVNAALTDNNDGTVTETKSGGSTLMWLKDANFSLTDGFDTDGLMTWDEANAWITYLNTTDFDSDGTPGYANYGDWRLPQALPVNGISYDLTVLSSQTRVLRFAAACLTSSS